MAPIGDIVLIRSLTHYLSAEPQTNRSAARLPQAVATAFTSEDYWTHMHANMHPSMDPIYPSIVIQI